MNNFKQYLIQKLHEVDYGLQRSPERALDHEGVAP